MSTRKEKHQIKETLAAKIDLAFHFNCLFPPPHQSYSLSFLISNVQMAAVTRNPLGINLRFFFPTWEWISHQGLAAWAGQVSTLSTSPLTSLTTNNKHHTASISSLKPAGFSRKLRLDRFEESGSYDSAGGELTVGQEEDEAWPTVAGGQTSNVWTLLYWNRVLCQGTLILWQLRERLFFFVFFFRNLTVRNIHCFLVSHQPVI